MTGQRLSSHRLIFQTEVSPPMNIQTSPAFFAFPHSRSMERGEAAGGAREDEATTFAGSVASKRAVGTYHRHRQRHPFASEFWRRVYVVGRFFTWATTYSLGECARTCIEGLVR